MSNKIIKTKTRSQGQRPGNNKKKQGDGKLKSKSIIISRTEAPVASGYVAQVRKPIINLQGSSKQDLRVSHTEYIRDVPPSTGAFTIPFSLGVNPGDPLTFPWLSTIASRFESYRFKRLTFKFVTESPTSERGYIVLVLDYDPSDTPPLDKTTALQYQSSVRGAPWETFNHNSTMENLNKRRSYFVRNAPLLASQDIQLYDTGTLYTIVGANVGTANLGELWVEYDIELMTPQIASAGSGNLDFRAESGGTVSLVQPLGSAPIITFNPQAFLLYNAGVFTSLVQSRFLVILEAISSVAVTAVNFAVGAGATIIEIFPLANSATAATRGFIITVPVSGTFTPSLVGTSVASSRMTVTTYSL